MLIPALLTGCASEPTAPSRSDTPGTSRAAPTVATSGNIQELLARASRSTPPASIELTIEAAEQALALDKPAQAAAILEQVAPGEYPELRKRAIYVSAEIALASERPMEALDILRRPDLLSGTLSKQDQIRLGKIRADASDAAFSPAHASESSFTTCWKKRRAMKTMSASSRHSWNCRPKRSSIRQSARSPATSAVGCRWRRFPGSTRTIRWNNSLR